MPDSIRKLTINEVVKNQLCNSCGACAAVCRYNSISFYETVGGHLFPEIDQATCTHCGICYDVCPGINLRDSLLRRMPDEPFIGDYINTYAGTALNKELFNNAQSGGVVSALLAYALESNQINGALTVYMQEGNPPRPITRIAKNLTELYHSQKSKYSPVPVLTELAQLKEFSGRIAVVGTSCQIHGLYNILDLYPGLQQKIAFSIGLICDRVMTCAAIDYLLYKANFLGKKSLLHFRDKAVSGFPGNVHVISELSSSVVMPAKTRIQIKPYLTPPRCRICFDKMNVFSDITVGDPHGIKDADRSHGESSVITRTKIGARLLKEASDQKAVTIRSVNYEQIIKGQGIIRKMREWHGFAKVWKELGKPFPEQYNHIKSPEEKKLVGLNGLRKNLQFSLHLDLFTSREALIKHVAKTVRKKKIKKVFLLPFKLFSITIKKSLELIGK